MQMQDNHLLFTHLAALLGVTTRTRVPTVLTSRLRGPIATEETDTSSPPGKKIFDLPTVRPFRKIGKNPDILARREDALTKGADTIGKAYVHNAVAAPRRLYEHTFPKEPDLLFNTFSVFERQPVTVKHIYGYRLHRVSYQALVQILKEMRDLQLQDLYSGGYQRSLQGGHRNASSIRPIAAQSLTFASGSQVMSSGNMYSKMGERYGIEACGNVKVGMMVSDNGQRDDGKDSGASK
ncbi:hypothetical protein DFH08DRAFT_940181 [Mycena albidolilacea]|uniref:Uncharacterized protein n=1 Tax=Mycena albidolilacea TaxID=1033008 RepID=A0AAD6ZPN4_9AGAR|nr:hypothetical protein DFH08DRAFT_940181 [Mycena albidolilacea]